MKTIKEMYEVETTKCLACAQADVDTNAEWEVIAVQGDFGLAWLEGETYGLCDECRDCALEWDPELVPDSDEQKFFDMCRQRLESAKKIS